MGNDKVLSPESHLGFPVGADRRLTNWQQISEYFHRLSQESDRIRVEEIGKSTEGRAFLLATISSPSNLANLEHYQSIQQKLADPRRLGGDTEAQQLLAEGKTICLITCGIHATEVGSSQMSMELAYDLLTGNDEVTKQVLENVILLLVPSLNPDGLDLVVDWYEGSVGKPWEGLPPPRLYQKYCGHDNNRDWFMATQVETRLMISKVHNVWHPHIVHDQHQQGSEGPRFVLPPFIDPYDQNVDPALRAMVNWLGMSMASELTASGYAGVATNMTYDAFSPSRAYQHYHGGVRILSEAASVRLATPIRIEPRQMREVRGFDPRVATWNHPLPWAGGDWRLRDIVDYDKACAFACLKHAARYRDAWVKNFYAVSCRAVGHAEAPYAFIVPLDQRDPVAAAEMLEVLMFGKVEVVKAKDAFEADGGAYPAGTLVIPLNQPYGRYAKTLLEAQPYPDLRLYPGGPPKRPYDITAHSLPIQMDVKVVAVNSPLEVGGDRLSDSPKTISQRVHRQASAERLSIDPCSNRSFEIVNNMLQLGVQVSRLREEQDNLPVGTFILRGDSSLLSKALEWCNDYGIPCRGVAGDLEATAVKTAPSVGIYRSHLPNADEGWTRFVLEQYDFTYRSLYDADIRQGAQLSGLDCLVLPSSNTRALSYGLPALVYPPEYSGGLGSEGAENIRRFVNKGGTLIALDAACDWAIKELWLPVANALEGLTQEKFYVPGSFLRILIDETHPVNYGLPRETSVLFLHSPAFAVGKGARSLADYPVHNPLVAGWILGHEHLYGKSALVEVQVGKGRVILCGFRPQFRAQARGTYKFLFNAFYASVAEKQ